jgi:hypothetical protein
MSNAPAFDADDQALVAKFQGAWQRTIEAFTARAGDAGAEELVAAERARTRAAIERAKTPDALVQWFLRFLADASPGERTLSGDTGRLRRVILVPERFEHFRSVLLFALISYEGQRAPTH